MMLGAETYEKTHSDRYDAQLKLKNCWMNIFVT